MKTYVTGISFILLLLGSVVLHAVADSEKVVGSVSVFGNRRANAEMIHRVITLKKGTVYNKKAVKQSKERLKELGIFSLIDIETREDGEHVAVIINVKEKTLLDTTLNARLNAGRDALWFQDEEAEKSSFGVGIGMNDFSGRRQRVKLSLSAGQLNRVGLIYRKQFRSGLSLGGSLANHWYKSPTFEGRVEKFKGRLFLAQRFGNLGIRLWGEYRHLKSRNEEIQLPEKKENRLSYGLEIRSDNHRLSLFPYYGVDVLAGFSQVFSGGGEKLYNRYLFQLSSYFNLYKRSVLAMDIGVIVSEGNVPVDERVYFGGYRTLRSRPVREYSGNQALMLSLEYRVPLAGFSRYSKRSRFLGAAVYLFSDFGLIAEHTNEWDLDDLKYNTGAGFILALDKESVLRLDMGVFPKFRIVFSTGWKF